MKQSSNSYFIDRHQGGERALVVHADFFSLDPSPELAEFLELARSAKVVVLDVITTRRDKPDSKYFIGLGKAEDILSLVKEHKADVVLFNHTLSPAQSRNLEAYFQCRVLDRSELILDIFAQRARTFEGKLQVELAQLQHIRSRLVRGWTHLERQKGGIGLRGPGETQLEMDRRLLDIRVKFIQKRLQKVLKSREQGRRARKRADIPTISLVGYTNAGKSTLFNVLTDSKIYAADLLFATLDPTIRSMEVLHFGKVVLTDTVGFIRDLPHDLVAAFRATLEETRLADLLLHVVDCSQKDFRDTIGSVNDVLKEIGAASVPQVQIFNKIDLLPDPTPRIEKDSEGNVMRVYVSAKEEKGLDLLQQAIQESLAGRMVNEEVVIAQNEGKLRAELYELGAVSAEFVDEEGFAHLQISLPFASYQRIFSKRIVLPSDELE